MADERPAVAPEWATTADPVDVDSAPSGKIDAGWVAGEAPPHDWVNFLFKNSADWDRYLDSVAQSLASMNWEQAVGEGTDGVFTNGSPLGGDYDPISGWWVLFGGSDGCWVSKDDTRAFVDFGTGMTSSRVLFDGAIGGSSSAMCVGNSSSVYRRDTILSGSWGTLALPGTVGSISRVIYDTSNSRYIVLGNDGAGEPYVATSDNPTGTALTERSDNLPSVFDGGFIVSAAVSDAGVVVATQGGGAATKFAFSTDGGVAWGESTSVLVAGDYSVAWSSEVGVFVAVRVDSTVNNYVYTSPDGDVWTLKFSGSFGFGNDIGNPARSVAFLRHAIVVGGNKNSQGVLTISEDLGATWSTLALSFAGSGFDAQMVPSKSGGKLLALQDDDFVYRSPRVKAG